MNIGLQVFRYETVNSGNLQKSFRFAVVDFSKSKGYPSNFVCMLPLQLGATKSNSIFLQVFGDQSLEQAKALLKDALERENDSDVKAEIQRRLKLLELKKVDKIKCSGCGKLFQPRRIRRFKSNFCEECMKKKFGTPIGQK